MRPHIVLTLVPAAASAALPIATDANDSGSFCLGLRNAVQRYQE